MNNFEYGIHPNMDLAQGASFVMSGQYLGPSSSIPRHQTRAEWKRPLFPSRQIWWELRKQCHNGFVFNVDMGRDRPPS